MDIICAKCGGHFNSIESVKEHAKNCPGKKASDFDHSHLTEKNSDNSHPKNTKPLEIVYPPIIPFPKKAKMGKPFLGAFKNKELVDDKERFCGKCHNKGLVAHIVKKKGYTYIDAFWCPNCNTALWPNSTSTS